MHPIDGSIHFSSVLCVLNMFDWLTFQWLMNNLGWIVFGLLLSLGLLLLFPILLGIQLKNETKDKDTKP